MNDAIKRNAIPAGLIGAGITWLVLGRRGTDAAIPEGVADAAARAGETVETTYRSYPLTAGVAAALAGAALAFALPMGERERRVLTGVGEKLGEGLKLTAKGTTSGVKRATKQVAGRARRQK